MMLDKSPEQLAQEEVKKAAITLGRWVMDNGRRFFSLSLLKLVGVGIATIVIGAISLPILAAVGCGVVIALALGYAVYAHKLLEQEREARRWAFVRGKRQEQKTLDAEQRLDEAALALMGKPEDRASVRLTPRTPELAKAVALLRYRATNLQTGQHPQPLTIQLPGSTPPQEPDLKPVRTRISERRSEREALEAEIQSLAVPEDIVATMTAEEARKHAKSVADSAHRATQAARNRKRRGLHPTQPEPGISLGLTFRPDGMRNVQRLQPGPTPEQIADGLTETPHEESA